jgi:hypothetical protein
MLDARGGHGDFCGIADLVEDDEAVTPDPN